MTANNRDASVKIETLLRTATLALIEAGEIARANGIPFMFQAPNGDRIRHDSWVSSACYESDGWYYNGYATIAVGEEVFNIDADSHVEWQSSDASC